MKAGPLQSTSYTLHDAFVGDKIWSPKVGFFYVNIWMQSSKRCRNLWLSAYRLVGRIQGGLKMCKPHSSIYSLPTSSYDALGHDDIPVWGSAKVLGLTIIVRPLADAYLMLLGRFVAGDFHLPCSCILLPALANCHQVYLQGSLFCWSWQWSNKR